MQTERLQIWLQIAGLVGVALSLVFVGMQMEETQRIAYSNAYQARASSSIAVKTAALSSPALLRAHTKSKDGQLDAITTDERIAATYFLWSQLVYLENEHYQYQNGFISIEQWQTNIHDLQDLFGHELNREIWAEESGGNWRASFRAEVEQVINR